MTTDTKPAIFLLLWRKENILEPDRTVLADGAPARVNGVADPVSAEIAGVRVSRNTSTDVVA